MTPPRREDEVRLSDGELRERLARLEARSESHDRASAERHGQLLAALQALQARVEQVEGRAWKLALVLLLGAGGAAGGAELAQRLLAGG